LGDLFTKEFRLNLITKPSLGLAAFLAVAMIGGAHAEPTPGSKPASIDRNGTLILVRASLLALDQANKTGNYTVLRDLGAPGFQVNTAAKLSEIFAQLRRDNLDLSGAAVTEPQITVAPEVTANGLLHMKGFFPGTGAQINFELLYAPVDGQWRLFGVSVGLGQAAPAPAKNPPASRPGGR
jgi:hypothetical protein